MKPWIAAAFAAGVAVTPALAQERTSAPETAEVYIVSPTDGATVASPVTVRFGLSGMGVAPAGVEREVTGHHHLIVNVAPEDVDMAQAVPSDDQHLHFGGGQTEATLDLPPGEHRLWLLLGDAFHVPHDPPVMSEPIRVTVE
ncbi:DUF4399 domain-containing protein [Rhodosalinus sp.]|uniref:DUF4399 domain-containing protein n=1 Tax=Rhodosalinus sp. TaxID=2047741 RepID=UPI00356387B8